MKKRDFKFEKSSTGIRAVGQYGREQVRLVPLYLLFNGCNKASRSPWGENELTLYFMYTQSPKSAHSRPYMVASVKLVGLPPIISKTKDILYTVTRTREKDQISTFKQVEPERLWHFCLTNDLIITIIY